DHHAQVPPGPRPLRMRGHRRLRRACHQRRCRAAGPGRQGTAGDVAPAAGQPGPRGTGHRLQLQGRQRLRGEERRQLLRRDAGLRQQGQPDGPGGGAVAVREAGPHGRLRLPRDQELLLQRGPLRAVGGPHAPAFPTTVEGEALMLYAQVHLTLPAWVHDAVDASRTYDSDADKVALAIALSRRNLEARTGGPFGAAVFNEAGRIVAAGVNVVLPQNTSLGHAETMAYMLAQQRMQRARLNRDDAGNPDGRYTLATSAQPCCQCYGAT